MVKELVLTPEELFYLGKLYEGKYLNYTYIAAMKDIGKNKRSFRDRCKDSLMSQGIIEIDLMGDVTSDEEVKDFLSPIYFSEFCATLDIVQKEKIEEYKTVCIYPQDKGFLLVERLGDKYLVKSITEKELQVLVSMAFSEIFPLAETEVKEEDITKMVVVKNAKIGAYSNVKIYYGSDAYICEKDKSDKWHILNTDEFADQVMMYLKGDVNLGL